MEKNKEIKPVDDNALPPEFKKFDKPLGLEQHVLNMILLIPAHLLGGYGFFYLILFGVVSKYILPLCILFGYIAGLGTTVGAHRYWTHRSFKANKPLQVLLMLMQTMAYQYPIFKWSRDHRVHHKYTDTDADPHNSKRGFWFSHIFWLFLPKHPEVEEKLKIIDISDLARDPVVRFQSKYYWEIGALINHAIPMILFQWLFPELTFMQNLSILYTRIILSLNFTFLVNSAAHLWGNKPYDKDMSASQNILVSLFGGGEGWHNYHHVFPWDCKTGEFPFHLNLGSIFIHFFAWIGWSYDLKIVSHQLLVDRINRTGDGSHPLHNHDHDHHSLSLNSPDITEEPSPLPAWGWGDREINKEDAAITETTFKRRG